MKIKQILSIILAFALLFSFSACRNRGEETPAPEPNVSEEDELVIYHNNTELAQPLISLAEKYSAATGTKVSAKLAGSDFMGEIKSKGAAIYVVDTHSDLSSWHSGGLFTDIMNDASFSSAISQIPAGIQLNSQGLGSYGVPLMLEGYGYIFDTDMLSALFGEEKASALADDLRTCSFTEFEGFVAAVDTYISAPSAAKITINGNEYTFAPEKTGKAQNLTGVFSLNSESTRAMEHLLSYGLAAKFASRYDVMSADENAVSSAKDIFAAYIEVLDMHTSHIAGAEGSIGRGENFVGGDYTYSTSVDLFTNGYALFYPGGTSDAADFEKSNAAFGENLDIIPMKLPLSDENISAAGMTAEKLQSSIVIGSRFYLAVNPNADENRVAAAKEFISWLWSSKGGSVYSEVFGGVPYNFAYDMTSGTENSEPMPENSAPESETSAPPAESKQARTESAPEENPAAEQNPTAEPVPSHSIKNSLYSAVAEYYATGNWIPDMSSALPADFAEKVLGEGTADYWGMETWTEQNRTDFSDMLLSGWKTRLNKENTAVG